MLSYLGVWSLELFSSTFFSTSSKKKKFQLIYLFTITQALPYGCSFVTYGYPGVLQQVTLPSFGMMCSISQLTAAHLFLSLFIFFCHRHHMEYFLFSDLRIYLLYISSEVTSFHVPALQKCPNRFSRSNISGVISI